MRKLVFLKSYHIFDKDTFRVIMVEDSECYYVQIKLNSDELFKLPKRDNGVLFQVV